MKGYRCALARLAEHVHKKATWHHRSVKKFDARRSGDPRTARRATSPRQSYVLATARWSASVGGRAVGFCRGRDGRLPWDAATVGLCRWPRWSASVGAARLSPGDSLWTAARDEVRCWCARTLPTAVPRGFGARLSCCLHDKFGSTRGWRRRARGPPWRPPRGRVGRLPTGAGRQLLPVGRSDSPTPVRQMPNDQLRARLWARSSMASARVRRYSSLRALQTLGSMRVPSRSSDCSSGVDGVIMSGTGE